MMLGNTGGCSDSPRPVTPSELSVTNGKPAKDMVGRTGRERNASAKDCIDVFDGECCGHGANVHNSPTCSSKAKSESSGSSTTDESSPVLYYGVCLPLGSSCTDDEEVPLVFTDKKAALRAVKKYKGARFKPFHKKEEAVAFANLPPEQLCATPPAKNTSGSNATLEAELNQGEKVSPFKAPRSQDLVKLRKFIESGDAESFRQTVWSNPRYLVSNGDTPAILQEGFRYNALHVSAKCKQPIMCQLILDIIEDPKFMELLYSDDSETIRRQRVNFLTDLYINTPDKGLCETPLHFASKFGCARIVEMLLAHPACDRNRVNKYGRTPRDIICERCPDGGNELKKQIDLLFEERMYVPLLRSEDQSAPPVIGKPWSPEGDDSLESLSAHSSPRSPCEPQLTIKALAGPMSPKQAETFYKQWKSPSSRQGKVQARLLHKMRLADTDKGLERAGRDLARKLKVPWSEYWDFLGCWCDLTSSPGLSKLENHLKNMYNKVMSEAAVHKQKESTKKNKNSPSLIDSVPCPLPNGNSNIISPSSGSSSPSPMTQICRKLEGFHIHDSNSPPLMDHIYSETRENRNVARLLNFGSPCFRNNAMDRKALMPNYLKTADVIQNLVISSPIANNDNCIDNSEASEEGSNNIQANYRLLCRMLSRNLTTAIFEVISLLHDDGTHESSVYRLLLDRSLPYLPHSFVQLTSSSISGLRSLHTGVGEELCEALRSALQVDEMMQFHRCLKVPLGSLNHAILSSDEEDDPSVSYPSHRRHCSSSSISTARQHLKCIFRIMCFHMCKLLNMDCDRFTDVCSCRTLPSEVPVSAVGKPATKNDVNSTKIVLSEEKKGRHKHKHTNGDAELLSVRSPVLGSKGRSRTSKRNNSSKGSLSDLSNDDVLTENEESDSDDVFVTPPSSAGSTRSSTPQEVETPEEGAEVFIQGSTRSKMDLHVFRAIEGVYIDPILYPHTLRWKHLVGTYMKEDLNNWPTPVCLKRQSSLSCPSTPCSTANNCNTCISTPVSLRHHYANASSTACSMEPRNLYDSFLECEDGGGDR